MVHGTSLMELAGATVLPELFAGNLVREIRKEHAFELESYLACRS